MLSITCNEYNRKQRLNQIYDNGWQCAFASKLPKQVRYSQVMPWVYCKDYLNEVVWSNIYSCPCTVYGMAYDPAEFPMELTRLRLLVRDNTVSPLEIEKQCRNSKGLLRDFDKLFGFRRTVLKRVGIHNKKSAVFIFEADKKWLVSPPLLSLFSLLCRAGRYWTEDFKGSPKKFVEKFVEDPFVEKRDSSAFKSIQNDREYLRTFVDNGGFEKLPDHVFDLFNRNPVDNYSKIPKIFGKANNYEIHNYGIQKFSYNGFPSYIDKG